MKLSKKAEPVRTYADNTEQYKKGEPFNPKIHKLLFDVPIPYGKYQKKTLEWVMNNDEWYYNWMQKECVIVSWGLCTTRIQSPVKKESSYLVDDEGNQWIGIRVCNEKCEPSKWL